MKRKVAKIVFNVVFYTALATLVLYIMINGLGLVKGLDLVQALIITRTFLNLENM